ncbi:MAG: MurR/RpiR family transcriptional regulator, partial [Spirochaetales bacterium]|nr:MurR/RpiR family transcriptional regulator [Spirochaetales bacterium]
ASGVSEATIHRLAFRMGFNSFSEMKNSVKDNLIRNRALINWDLRPHEKTDNWLEEYFQVEMSNISNTFTRNDISSIEEAGRMLQEAKKIWILGDKMGLGVTSYLNFLLNYLKGNAFHLNLSNFYEYLPFMKKDEVLVLVGFQRYCKKSEKVAQFVKQKGIRTIALTDCNLSPFAQIADVACFASTESVYFLDSYSSVLALAQALIVHMVDIDKENIRKNVEQTELVYDEFSEDNK